MTTSARGSRVPIDDLGRLLPEYGILGLLILALAYVTLNMWQQLTGSWQSRLTETRELIAVVHEANSTYKEIAGAMKARAEGTEALATAAENSAKRLIEVRDHLDLLQREVAKNRALMEQLERLTATLVEELRGFAENGHNPRQDPETRRS